MTDHVQELAKLGEHFNAARKHEREAAAALRAAVIAAHADGMNQSAAARHARVNRMTVRNFLGKPAQAKRRRPRQP